MSGLPGLLLAGLAMTAAAACDGAPIRLACAVTGVERLAAPMTEAAICRTLADALADAAGSRVMLADAAGPDDAGRWARIDLDIRSATTLSARLRHGRGAQAQDLPEAGFSVADRPLGQRQIELFAQSLAHQITAR